MAWGAWSPTPIVTNNNNRKVELTASSWQLRDSIKDHFFDGLTLST
jgi:hypothetical protein